MVNFLKTCIFSLAFLFNYNINISDSDERRSSGDEQGIEANSSNDSIPEEIRDSSQGEIIHNMASILAKKIQQAEQDMMDLLAEVNQIQDPQPVPGEPDQTEPEHIYSKTLDKPLDDNASNQDEQESNLETREKPVDFFEEDLHADSEGNVSHQAIHSDESLLKTDEDGMNNQAKEGSNNEDIVDTCQKDDQQLELKDEIERRFENEELKKELNVEEINPDSNYPDIIHLNEVELTIDAATLDNQTVDNIHSNENDLTTDNQTADIIQSNENDLTSDEVCLDNQTADIIHSKENDLTTDDQTADIIHLNENELTFDQASGDNQTAEIIDSNENEPIINEPIQVTNKMGLAQTT